MNRESEKSDSILMRQTMTLVKDKADAETLIAQIYQCRLSMQAVWTRASAISQPNAVSFVPRHKTKRKTH